MKPTRTSQTAEERRKGRPAEQTIFFTTADTGRIHETCTPHSLLYLAFAELHMGCRQEDGRACLLQPNTKYPTPFLFLLGQKLSHPTQEALGWDWSKLKIIIICFPLRSLMAGSKWRSKCSIPMLLLLASMSSCWVVVAMADEAKAEAKSNHEDYEEGRPPPSSSETHHHLPQPPQHTHGGFRAWPSSSITAVKSSSRWERERERERESRIHFGSSSFCCCSKH